MKEVVVPVRNRAVPCKPLQCCLLTSFPQAARPWEPTAQELLRALVPITGSSLLPRSEGLVRSKPS